MTTPKVSIHAPAWGATVNTRGAAPYLQRFNPRARVGRDTFFLTLSRRYICFNPRARVGRDPCSTFSMAGKRGFNPRARVGRDGGINTTNLD